MKKTKRGGGLNIGSALAALAAKEGHALVQALGMHQGHHGGIHETRRASRRLRSLLAFVASARGQREAEALDRSLKKLTRSFSTLRDAHVAVRTARVLAGSDGTGLTPALLELLEQRCANLLDAALEQDPGWQRRSDKAQHIVSTINSLDWQAISLASAKQSLRHNIARMKKARRAAQELRTDDAFHRLRRRGREVRYQLEFLRKARHAAGLKKSYARHYAKRIKRLGLSIDRLGWRQDFQVFRQALDQLPAHADVQTLREALAKKAVPSSRQPPLGAGDDSREATPSSMH
ncbi:CHAD domain-containing protein [Dyella mobilis]|uniref:CHAD domain-containing protein n=1 Tax=Dyella mobilis TaxID=1849582 RepID=A0ABS2KJ25_9GAMM|nr:CHAD domain-containing protein [Dyella mobilis]MBM7131167.1 CHAD domain-containing protein [Dyella mobilis]GLQ98899.1 hypothetical protein GCM10007863_33190 [Dyella mobilis]